MEGWKEEGRKQKPVGDMLGTFLFLRLVRLSEEDEKVHKKDNRGAFTSSQCYNEELHLMQSDISDQ